MLSDFTMVTHMFPERPDLKIYPVADVHLGAAEHMKSEWEAFCKKVLEDPNAYLILAGDLLNNGTRNSLTNVFEETMRPRDQKTRMCELLEPIKDRSLCIVNGNHERRNKDVDNDIGYDIACKLDIEDRFRQNVCFLKIRMGDRAKVTCGPSRPTYVIVVTHGAGGGMLTGGAVNRAERFGYVMNGADALILGHTHKPFVTQPSQIRIDARNETVTLVPFKVISVTSWLQWGGYAAQKMLSPTSFAPQCMTLMGKEKKILVSM